MTYWGDSTRRRQMAESTLTQNRWTIARKAVVNSPINSPTRQTPC